MDVYDYLSQNNLIKRDKNLKKKKVYNTLSKYNHNKENDNIYDDIFISTEVNSIKQKKINKISNYINDIESNYLTISKLKNKFKNFLEEYELVTDINDLKCGGYVRYITLNENLKFGGILLKISKNEDLMENKLLLKNMNNKIWNINFNNYYIFYKKHKTKNDKFRNIFIKVALLDE